MSRRPRRILPEDGYFHVTCLGVAKCAIFRDDHDRVAFRELLLHAADRFGLQYDAWCLMTTHVHAVIRARRSALSTGIHWVNGIYAQRFNHRHDRTGHLFASRFSAYLLETEEHWANACRYVFDNPVKAGLCERAADWPWSGGRLSGMR